jgi:DNA (cytosine-5)-methyltransferase 1
MKSSSGQMADFTISIGFDSKQGGDTQLGATEEKCPPLKGVARHAVASGINGSEIGYALRSNPSHSGDKGDGGVNTTLVAFILNSTMGDRQYEPGETFIPEIVSQAMSSKWSKGSSGPAGDEVANLIPTEAIPINMQAAGKNGKKSPNMLGVGNPGDPAMTVNASDQHAVGAPTKLGMSVRRLTPKECCRLQGFPDDYLDINFNCKPVTDGHKYKALGNSMAVPVIRWIGQRIEMLEEICPL